MTAAEFKTKWSRYRGKETCGYSEHFNDPCRLPGQPTPAEADPSGSDFFCFQKRVGKDAELFDLRETPDAGEPAEAQLGGHLDRKCDGVPGFESLWRGYARFCDMVKIITLERAVKSKKCATHAR